MAERRMFSKSLIDSDLFLSMSPTAQNLYFHLAMRADDDGFIGNPLNIQRMIGARDDDMRVLIEKRYIIPFESGIVVIRHWRIHNYIQKDRYKGTVYKAEKSSISLDEDGVYDTVYPECIQNVSSLDTGCIQNVSSLDTQDRLGKSKSKSKSNNNITCRAETPTSPSKTQDSVLNTQADEVIAYLNEKAGKHFRAVEATRRILRARFKDGFTVVDCKKVVDNKVAEWKGTEQEQYLRPSTLFQALKFDGYLNQAPVKGKPRIDPSEYETGKDFGW